MNKFLFTLLAVTALTGCVRGVSSGPSGAGEADDLQKWTDSVKAKKPTGNPPALPTLSKIEIFSYQAQRNKMIDPNPASASMRSSLDNAGASVSPSSSNSPTNPANPNSKDTGSKDTGSKDPNSKNTLTADPAASNPQPTPDLTASSSPEKADLRNPFAIPDLGSSVSNILRPDPARARQPLEGFALDSLKMIGTIGASNKTGLVMTPDRVTYRVDIGQYIGQQNGKVVAVEPGKITLVELVSDGQGGWIERETAIVIE